MRDYMRVDCDVTGGYMEQTFWLMWKTLPPVLVLLVLVFAVKYQNQKSRADSLWRSIVAYRREKHELVAKLAEAQSIANILRHRDEATCPCSEVKAAREEIARLREHNQQLTLNALVDGVKYIKRYVN